VTEAEHLFYLVVRDGLEAAEFDIEDLPRLSHLPNEDPWFLPTYWMTIFPRYYKYAAIKTWHGDLKFIKPNDSRLTYEVDVRLDYLPKATFRLENPRFPSDLIEYIEESWDRHLKHWNEELDSDPNLDTRLRINND
jgi:hypothetical protein